MEMVKYLSMMVVEGVALLLDLLRSTMVLDWLLLPPKAVHLFVDGTKEKFLKLLDGTAFALESEFGLNLLFAMFSSTSNL